MIAGCLALLVVALAAGAVPSQAPPPDAPGEQAVRELIARYAAARAGSNESAIQALFTEDADQLTSSGEWRRGRPDLVRGTLASSQRTGGTRTIAVERVRFVSQTLAIADARYEIAGLAGGATRRMWSTFVLVKARERWHITAIRNMLPAVPPAPPR